MVSAAFTFDGASGSLAKFEATAFDAVSATLDDLTGVSSVDWTIEKVDDTITAATFTLVTSGPKGSTVSFTASGDGTAAVLLCVVDRGLPTRAEARAKFWVPVASNGLEVGCFGETDESSAVYWTTALVNAAIRGAAGPSVSVPDLDPTSIQTSSYVATAGFLVRVNGTIAGITVTLPTAVGVAGKRIGIAEAIGGNHIFRAICTGAETIGGFAARSFGGAYSLVVFISDGVRWLVDTEPGPRAVLYSALPTSGGYYLAFPNSTVRGPGDGTFALRLPLAAECNGTTVTVRETLGDNITNEIVIARTSTDEINEATTATVTNGSTLAFRASATGVWIIVSQYPGSAGTDGTAATIDIAGTNTLAPGSPATVTNLGDTTAAILEFGIPEGQPGATGPMGPAMFLFGSSGTGTSTALRYMPPGFSDTAVATTTIDFRTPFAFTANSIYAYTPTPGVSGDGTGTFAYTLTKNGVATALTMNMLVTVGSGEVTGGSVSFAVGDRVGFTSQGSGTIGSGTGRITFSVGIT